ncbi:MAG: tetraacyldisaccharide 4'-kinase, partial [Acidobacteria bacterium]|nr:tetraacyldisaccharide 4'-kinase [Acidobacteriota bacterium]
HFGATVHLLDDGFQHLPLARGTDLLIVTPEDLADSRTLPCGRLRESLEAASAAHALLVADASDDEASRIGSQLGVPHLFRLAREAGAACRLDDFDRRVPVAVGKVPVHAVAAIARPERFFEDLRASGWPVAGTTAYPDHHRFTSREIADLVATARRGGAAALMTTEKDLMRLQPFRPLPLPVMWLPLRIRVEPADAFARWLCDRLADERAACSGDVS